MKNIQLFTTPLIDGVTIEKYYGIVTANQVAGTGFFTDLTASFSDLFGGNSGAYRESMNGLCRDVTERLKEKAAETIHAGQYLFTNKNEAIDRFSDKVGNKNIKIEVLERTSTG